MTINDTTDGSGTPGVGGDRLPSVQDASFLDPAIQQKPFAYYRTLRQDDPVHFEEALGLYLVSRHEDLMTVLKDPVLFSQEQGYYKMMAGEHLPAMKEVLEREGGGFFPDVANVDPPKHTRVRKLLGRAFGGRRMQSLEPQFEQTVNELIDGFIESGRVDGLHDLAVPMAISFSMQQLDVHDLDPSDIKRWGSAYLSQFNYANTREQMIEAARDLATMQNYLIDVVRRRMAEPGEDMLSDIIRQQRPDEEPLTFEELVATARALLINTHDSMSTAFTNILFGVATNPVVAEKFYTIADDDAQLGRFNEELLRIEPPVRALARVTTAETTLGGTDLPAGAQLLVLFASGNDDESVFGVPRQFDPDRANLRRSLTFGAGTHVCLGIALARMQLLVASRLTARRMKDLRLAIPVEDIRFIPNAALLAMEQLPLAFTPGGRS